MIVSFKDKKTETVFRREGKFKQAASLKRAALKKLLILNASTSLEDLRVPPGNCLEKLMADRVGQFSIRVNDQWRICFRWENGDAHDVELVDYH